MMYSEEQLKEILDIHQRLIDYGHSLWGMINSPLRGMKETQDVTDEAYSVLERAKKYPDIDEINIKANFVSKILKESGIEEKVTG